jgi:hypothetical protein
LGSVALVARTDSEAQTAIVTGVLQNAVGSFKDEVAA